MSLDVIVAILTPITLLSILVVAFVTNKGK